jgi:outer membrane lipoprotein SlyB
MKTNLTQKQLDQLAVLITLGENKDGTLFIKDVRGSVYGSVQGNVFGSVCGDIKGGVYGNVEGNVEGNVQGQIAGKCWTSLEYREVNYDL